MRSLLLGLCLQSGFFGFQPVAVIAFVGDAVSAVEFENPTGSVVQKITVVGDRYHGARVVLQEAFDPRHALGV